MSIVFSEIHWYSRIQKFPDPPTNYNTDAMWAESMEADSGLL